jgi:hypothetical protein
MREFVPAGGELMIHVALHSKNHPTSELIIKEIFITLNMLFFRAD